MFVYPPICRLDIQTRTAAKPRSLEEWCLEMVLSKLNQLAAAGHWQAILELESEARAVASAVLAELPQSAAARAEYTEFRGRGPAFGAEFVFNLLGLAHKALGNFGKSIECHTQHLAIAKEAGNRAGECAPYANLGETYHTLGDFDRAIECNKQCLAIAKEVGDRQREGDASGILGSIYRSMGDFGKAIEFNIKCLAIAKEVGDQKSQGDAYGNLGACYTHVGEYDKAVTCHKAQHAIGTELQLEEMQGRGALGIGVALRFHLRAVHQGLDRLTGHCTPEQQGQRAGEQNMVAAVLFDGVPEATKWLQTASAFGSGLKFAKLHLAHLLADAGQVDAALEHLRQHLSWRVQLARHICAACGQTRGEDKPMLTCSGCRVARFCSADHQKMASKKVELGGNLMMGRHKDICGVLGKWRQVVKDGVAPDSCTADLVAFLQKC